MKQKTSIKKTSVFTKRSFIVIFLTSFVTYIISNLTYLIEGIFIGQNLDTNALTVYGISSIFNSVPYIFAAFLMTGIQIVIINYITKGNITKARQTFFSIVVLVLIVSVLIVVLVIAHSYEIAKIFGARDSASYITVDTSNYLKILSLSLPPQIFIYVLSPVVQIDKNRRFLYISSASILVSAVIFYFVNFNIFDGGLFGVAWAYDFAEYIGLIVLISCFFRKNSTLNFKPKAIDFKKLPIIITKSLPDVFLSVLRLLKPISFNSILLEIVSVSGVTAISIFNNLSTIIFSFSSSISAATIVLTSVYYNEKDHKECRDTLKLSILICVITLVPVGLLVYIFSPQIISIYTTDYFVVEYAIYAVAFGGLAYIFEALTRVFTRTFQATNHGIYATVLNCAQMYVFPIVAAILLGNIFGAFGIWFSILLAPVLCIVLYLLIIFIDKFIHRQSESYLDCYSNVKSKIFRSLCATKADCNFCLEQAYKFLASNDIENEKTNEIISYIKYLLFHIVNYPDIQDNAFTAELRIVIDNGKVAVSIRDNSKIANRKLEQIFNDKKPLSNSKLDVIEKSALENTQFSEILKYNNLVSIFKCL